MTAMEELQVCVHQKQIFLTRLADLSQQVETQCCRPEPSDPSPLLRQRQVYLDRLKKCTDRISALLRKLSPEEHGRMDAVFSANLPKSQCSPVEMEIMEKERECRSLLSEISASDAESARQMKRECDRLQKLVNDSRSKGKKDSLFSGYSGLN